MELPPATNQKPLVQSSAEKKVITVIYTCPICKTKSKNVEGHEVWARECGFYELLRVSDLGHSGYSVCSKQCAASLLKILMAREPEIKPAGNPTRTWKCEQCGVALPKHIFSEQQEDGSEKFETVPTTAQIVYPYEWSKYHCFCSDVCLLQNLTEAEIVTCAE